MPIGPEERGPRSEKDSNPWAKPDLDGSYSHPLRRSCLATHRPRWLYLTRRHAQGRPPRPQSLWPDREGNTMP